jgi:hypothetical protein
MASAAAALSWRRRRGWARRMPGRWRRLAYSVAPPRARGKADPRSEPASRLSNRQGDRCVEHPLATARRHARRGRARHCRSVSPGPGRARLEGSVIAPPQTEVASEQSIRDNEKCDEPEGPENIWDHCLHHRRAVYKKFGRSYLPPASARASEGVRVRLPQRLLDGFPL